MPFDYPWTETTVDIVSPPPPNPVSAVRNPALSQDYSRRQRYAVRNAGQSTAAPERGACLSRADGVQPRWNAPLSRLFRDHPQPMILQCAVRRRRSDRRQGWSLVLNTSGCQESRLGATTRYGLLLQRYLTSGASRATDDFLLTFQQEETKPGQHSAEKTETQSASLSIRKCITPAAHRAPTVTTAPRASPPRRTRHRRANWAASAPSALIGV